MIKQQCEQNSCIQQQQQQQQQQNQQQQQQQQQSNSTAATTDKTEKSNTKESADTTECIENLSKMQLIDDNSSFFSHNTFQKIVPDHDSSSYSTDSSSVTPHSNILNDNLPDINSSEDWEAAFGFSNKKSESPVEQNQLPASNRNSIVSENSLNHFGSTQSDSNFVKLDQHFNHLESYQKPQNFTEKSRDILEALNRSQYNQSNQTFKLDQNDLLNSSAHAPFGISLSQTKLQENINGLDQQMSKFFAEFNKSNQQKDLSYNGFSHQGSNGFIANERHGLGLSESEYNMLLLNQCHQRALDRQLEEQAMLNLKQSLLLSQRQQLAHHGQPFITNGLTEHYITQNGQAYHHNPSGFTQNSVFQVSYYLYL